MLPKLKELRDKQKNILTLARQKLEEIKDDTPEVRAKEIEAEHDRAMVDYDKLGEQITRAQKLEDAEKRAEEESRARRPHGENTEVHGSEGDDKDPDEKRTFTKLLQFGVSGLSLREQELAKRWQSNLTPEQRALAIGTQAAGGYTVPQGFSGEIDKNLLAWGPMLDPGVTRVITTETGNTLPWPTMDDTGQIGALITENTAVATQDITFAAQTFSAYMYTSKMIQVSLQLLMDSAFNVDTEIIEPAFGQRIGRIANQHLTTGTGGGAQPNGIVTASGLGATTAAVGAVTADELIGFYHTIDPAFRSAPMFKFMFNDSTLQALRKLKDGFSRYLIDGLDNNAATIKIAGISVPYVINQAMPSMATGNKFMVGGDFSKYVVRKVRDFQVMTLRERYAEYFQVAFLGFARFDGGLLNNTAVKYMKNA